MGLLSKLFKKKENKVQENTETVQIYVEDQLDDWTKEIMKDEDVENVFTKVKCKLDDTKIPEGKYIEQCVNYEWDEKDHTSKNIFKGSPFGGLF